MKNKGKILACDIHNSRLKLVEENAKRLGVSIIDTKIEDATKFNEQYIGKFDKVLVDVPCLGFGVMKRKPDIKWQRKKEDIDKITKIQLKILENCMKYLKTGGELVYSTCSILQSENEKIVKQCLETKNIQANQHNMQYEIEEECKIIPNENSDGFFMCKIKKLS